MKTLSIISHKGGAGKTCTAVLIAEELSRRGFRVLLVDADRQRSAGLLLGIESPSGYVQETQHPRLRYLSSTGIAIREVPARVHELRGLFDVAVADTPSLDDPLARAWLQQSDAALMVVPVDPLSLKTLEGAEHTLTALHTLNGGIRSLGMLPTMYNEQMPTARTLLQELMARRAGDILTPPIPHDEGLIHRASPMADRRTQPSERARAAYAQVSDRVVEALELAEIYQVVEPTSRPRWAAEPQRAPASPVSTPVAAVPTAPSQAPAVAAAGPSPAENVPTPNFWARPPAVPAPPVQPAPAPVVMKSGSESLIPADAVPRIRKFSPFHVAIVAAVVLALFAGIAIGSWRQPTVTPSSTAGAAPGSGAAAESSKPGNPKAGSPKAGGAARSSSAGKPAAPGTGN